jgi:regulator of RNase E activity RraA
MALRSGSRVIGPAHVVLMSRDDNLAVREALAHPSAPGAVLVAAGGSASRTATIGGMLARSIRFGASSNNVPK